MGKLKNDFLEGRQRQVTRSKDAAKEDKSLEKIVDALDTLGLSGQRRVVRRIARMVPQKKPKDPVSYW